MSKNKKKVNKIKRAIEQKNRPTVIEEANTLLRQIYGRDADSITMANRVLEFRQQPVDGIEIRVGGT